jgi:hypothetical protein
MAVHIQEPSMFRDLTRQPHFAVLMGLAWLLVLAQLVAEYWPMTAVTMHDADDALRLVQVRGFLAGQGWFDLHESRLSPPLGYESHWSRLIDAGLAGLFLLFKPWVDQALAERLMAAVWPVLWLIPTIGGAAALAWRLAGREAALIVLLLAVFGLPGMGQFRPARIDHHNVQIALTVLAVAATAWSDRVRWTCWAAGALTGLALAIGFEGLALLVLCGAAFTLRYVVDRRTAPALLAYGASLAAGAAAAFLVSVPPAHWARSVCDAIAINSASAVIAGGLALSAAAICCAHERRWVRCAAGAAAAAIALAVFVLFEPRCLRGPYALMDPALQSIWLAHMSEMQSLADLMKKGPTAGIATAAFPALTLLALALLARRTELRRDFGFLVAAAAFGLALVIMLCATKFYAYAMWLGVSLVAVAALQGFRTLSVTSLAARFAVTLLITPTVVTIGAMKIASAAGIAGDVGITSSQREACLSKDNYAALARLPAGLVVANELEWGPFMLAWTPHAVLAAPYHRLSTGIVTAHRIFARPPEEARAILRDIRATYVVTCGPVGASGLSTDQQGASLGGRLQAGAVPGWLERLPAAVGAAVTAYRIRP